MRIYTMIFSNFFCSIFFCLELLFNS